MTPFYRIIEMTNELIQYTSGLCAYFFIIFDSIRNCEHHREFWKTFIKIDKRYSPRNIQFKYFLVLFIEHIAFSLLIYNTNMLFESWTKTRTIFAYVALWSVTALRMFYYVFCLKILLHQLKTIENEAKNLAEISHKMNHSETSPFNSPYDRKKLKWIREYFGCVNEMSQHLNEVFGWSQVSGILYCFYSFVTDLIWMYSFFSLKSFR